LEVEAVFNYRKHQKDLSLANRLFFQLPKPTVDDRRKGRVVGKAPKKKSFYSDEDISSEESEETSSGSSGSEESGLFFII